MAAEKRTESLPPTLQPDHELMLVAAGMSDVGPHKINEDSWLVCETRSGGQLLLVCDGMGGMGRGDEASQMAAQLLAERLVANADPAFEAVVSGIRRVDDELRRQLERGVDGRAPGSTAVLTYIEDGKVTVGWVGDSSVMLIREGRVVSRNRGHRLVQKLIEQGLMTEEDAKDSPMGRLLERSLGGREDDGETVKPGLLERWTLREGDYLVLCSDGLTDSIPHDEIPSLLGGNDMDALVARLIETATTRGVDDNITVVVAKCVTYMPDRDGGIGKPWRAALDDSVTLPPADYRSGILNRKALELIEREEGLFSDPGSPPVAIRGGAGLPSWVVPVVAGIVLLGLVAAALFALAAVMGGSIMM